MPLSEAIPFYKLKCQLRDQRLHCGGDPIAPLAACTLLLLKDGGTMKRTKQRMIGAVLGSTLLVFFQNCSRVALAEVPPSDKSSLLEVQPVHTDNTDLPEDPVACDPFSPMPTADCDVTSGEGLIGNIYYLPDGHGVQTYIDHGEKLKVTLLMSHFDIPTRTWTDGFPGDSGQPLLQSDGSVLNEWFALDLKGQLTLPTSMAEGMYQFALMSDDGSILDIDGQKIVDNDGTHPTEWKCGAMVNLKHGQPRSIRVRYYQGPRVEIALRLLMRPSSHAHGSCDFDGQFQIVPAEALSHSVM